MIEFQKVKDVSVIYKCSWSILEGLVLDEPISPDNHTTLTDRGFQPSGIIDDVHVIYYIKAVNGSRDVAVGKLREHIKNFMKRCVDEHNTVLVNSRSDWKNCK